MPDFSDLQPIKAVTPSKGHREPASIVWRFANNRGIILRINGGQDHLRFLCVSWVPGDPHGYWMEDRNASGFSGWQRLKHGYHLEVLLRDLRNAPAHE